MKRIFILLIIFVLLIIVFLFKAKIRQFFSPFTNRFIGKATIEKRIEQYGPESRKRLLSFFETAGISFPPKELILVGLKSEKLLEIWAKSNHNQFRKVKEYPILGISGTLGPKLQEGDMQVPEGIYEIESLNPNSRFHLSVRLNYPNEFDKMHAKEDNRNNPGSDIMIHGSIYSAGCLAMGNKSIEELFVLSYDTGINNIKVILSPLDFRKSELPEIPKLPEWIDELYAQIRKELEQLKP